MMEALKKDGIIKNSPGGEKPELFADLGDVYEGFILLGAGRGYNEAGPQPIPHSEIIAYMTERSIVIIEDRREFETLIRALDSKYLDLAHAKMARERERLSNSPKSGKGRKRT